MLLSLSTLYLRVCMDPTLEMEIGRVARTVGPLLHLRHELEADLFAIDWLVPPWMDEDGDLLARVKPPAGLTADAYRLFRLHQALEDKAISLPTEPEGVELLNRGAAGERERATRPHPSAGQLWQRAVWMLFNRQALRSRPDETVGARSEYFQAAGYPPRHVPELRGRAGTGAELDPELAWLPRIDSDGVEERVDATPWSPFLLPSGEDGHPRFHIPVRPVPSRQGKDSELGWINMTSSGFARPEPVSEWIERARRQQAGLLLFPRNPAEAELDRRGERSA
jgi:hypothetical protein